MPLNDSKNKNTEEDRSTCLKPPLATIRLYTKPRGAHNVEDRSMATPRTVDHGGKLCPSDLNVDTWNSTMACKYIHDVIWEKMPYCGTNTTGPVQRPRVMRNAQSLVKAYDICHPWAPTENIFVASNAVLFINTITNLWKQLIYCSMTLFPQWGIFSLMTSHLF